MALLALGWWIWTVRKAPEPRWPVELARGRQSFPMLEGADGIACPEARRAIERSG